MLFKVVFELTGVVLLLDQLRIIYQLDSSTNTIEWLSFLTSLKYYNCQFYSNIFLTKAN